MIAARGSMTIDAAALGARALGFIQQACSVWTGMYLPAPSTSLQRTFFMNSPYNPVFNVCYWRGYFGNGVDRSVPPRAVLYRTRPLNLEREDIKIGG